MIDELDVIVPCRNAPEVLWLTLTHLFAYGSGVRSVVLLDNCSDVAGMDGVLRRVALRRRPPVYVVRNEQNIGVWASVNRGLWLSRSRWVFVLTSDVLIGPDTLEATLRIARESDIPMLGPEVVDFLPNVPHLARRAETLSVDMGRHNGAAWLMDWPRLRERVGWFDSRFYICFGDTDYVERMRIAGDPYGVVVGLPCVHLDKQSRRHDFTAAEDSDVESEDSRRFHEKWPAGSDAARRHPHWSALEYVTHKPEWKELIPQ